MSGRRAKNGRAEEASDAIRQAVADATVALEPLFKNLNQQLRAQDQRLADLEERLAAVEGRPQTRPLGLILPGR